MATGHLLGSARLEYTPPGGSLVTHLLAAPLTELGVGVRDLAGTVRYENEPAALMALLDAGLRNVVITYRESAGGTAYPLLLVDVAGAVLREGYYAWWSPDGLARHVTVVGDGPVATQLLRQDRDRLGFGEYETRLHLRRVDGGDLTGLL